MNIERLPNGNLKMSADVLERDELRTFISEAKDAGITMLELESVFISDYLCNPMGDGISYEQVTPESCGALTDAPLISDGDNIYGYMNYQISNFLEELADGKEIKWQKG